LDVTTVLMFVKVTAVGNNSLGSGQASSGSGTVRPKPAARNRQLSNDKVQINAAASTTSDTDVSSAIPKKQRPKQAFVYTEVVPSKMRNKPAPEKPPQPSSSTNNQEDSTKNLYTNARTAATPMYENVQLQKTAKVSVEPEIFSLRFIY